MSKVGIYGGTFDPVHHGHLITAQSVREMRNLDKIIFIPSYISPHKLDQKASEPEHRLKMINTAIEDIPYFECSDFEISRQKISYTIDTLQELKKYYDEIELIIGEDNMETFYTWKSPEEIMKIVTLIVLKRKIVDKVGYKNKFASKAVFLETPRIDINSTTIRERVNKGLPIDFLVPQKVMKYIYELNLYKELN
jgi:nicotinate-nucleotide adenylyltransferase